MSCVLSRVEHLPVGNFRRLAVQHIIAITFMSLLPFTLDEPASLYSRYSVKLLQF